MKNRLNDKHNLRLYYNSSTENAGDYFTSYLIRKIYPSIKIKYSENNADLVGCGLILNKQIFSSNTLIWGAGFDSSEGSVFGNRNKVLAVRGWLSASKLSLNDAVIGDLGLLASICFSNRIEKKYKIGIVSDNFDLEDFEILLKNEDINLISIDNCNIESVLKEINKCEFILSSSLYGIIFAHSFGIPAIRIIKKGVDNREFEFKDYFSSINFNYTCLDVNSINFKNIYDSRFQYMPDVVKIKTIQKELLGVSPLSHNAVICCIEKFESKYIKEWVDYHIKLGFEHIYIYDNDEIGDNSLYKIFANYFNVTIIDVRGVSDKMLQKRAYSEFYDKYKYSFNYCAFIDIDEFIVLNKWRDVNEMLRDSTLLKYDSIVLGWRLFGSDGKLFRFRKKVFGKFKRQIFGVLNQKKIILKGGLEDVVFNSVHYASFSNKKMVTQVTVDYFATNEKIDYSQKDKNAYINHYMTKSFFEFYRQKIKRQNANLNMVNDLNYFFNINNQPSLKNKINKLLIQFIYKLKRKS